MGVVSGLVMAGTALYDAYNKRKAGKQAAEAIESAKVDPNKVANDARQQAIENARASLMLENQLTPENQRLRRSATGALQGYVNDPGSQAMVSQIDQQIAGGGDAEQSDLLTQSIAEAQKQLALGGQLDSETRNEVTRRAVARGGNTGAARFTTPRDLGLTSLQLATDRLERGGRFGQIDQGRNQQSFDNMSRLRELRDRLYGSNQNRAIQLAGFGQSLQPPDVGLAPGEFAGLAIGNQNIGAQAGMQRALNTSANSGNFGQAINAASGALGQIDWSKVGSIFNKN